MNLQQIFGTSNQPIFFLDTSYEYWYVNTTLSVHMYVKARSAQSQQEIERFFPMVIPITLMMVRRVPQHVIRNTPTVVIADVVTQNAQVIRDPLDPFSSVVQRAEQVARSLTS